MGDGGGLVSIEGLRKWGYGSAVFFVIMLVSLLLMVYRPKFCEGVLRTLLRVAPDTIGDRILHMYQSFVGGLAVLRDGGAVLISLVYTLIIWFTIVASEYMVVKAFGFSQISFFGTLFIMMSLACRCNTSWEVR